MVSFNTPLKPPSNVSLYSQWRNMMSPVRKLISRWHAQKTFLTVSVQNLHNWKIILISSVRNSAFPPKYGAFIGTGINRWSLFLKRDFGALLPVSQWCNWRRLFGALKKVFLDRRTFLFQENNMQYASFACSYMYPFLELIHRVI